MLRFGLRTKILFAVGFIIFGVLGTTTFIHTRNLRRYYLEAIEWRSEGLAQGILSTVQSLKNYNPNYAKNIQGLLEKLAVRCKQLYELNKEKNVTYVAVINETGVIAAHSDKELVHTPVSPLLKSGIEGHEQQILLDGGIYHTLIPIVEEQQTYLGTIDIGVPQNIVDEKIRQMFIETAELFCIFMLAAILMISWFLRILVISPVKRLVLTGKKIARGEIGNVDGGKEITPLLKRIHLRDEIDELTAVFRDMMTYLCAIASQVQKSGINVSSSAIELTATAREQETIVAQQIESMHEIVQSVKEISDVAVHLVQTMQHVASKSQETTAFVSSGQTDLTRMEHAMHQMEHASKSISDKLETINTKTEKITTVVTTITKVAEQTNLLSLNAAIEAEKAGESGRGFTVVAREIRRLADQTAVATLDIEQMVREMQSAVSAGVLEMDKFIVQVRHSASDVSKISVHLTGVIEQVQALSPTFEEVNVAMGHQSEHVQKINRAIQNVSVEMQQTKSSLKESYAAIQQLNGAARALQDEVSRFKIS